MSNLQNSEFTKLRKMETLTFREALYLFPNTEIAVLDADGVVVAANPLWIDAAFGGELIPMGGPQLGTNFFDVCRAGLSLENSSVVINAMKKVIVGEKEACVVNISRRIHESENVDSTNFECLFIFPISDSPNSIGLAHVPPDVSEVDLPKSIPHMMGVSPDGLRDFN